MKYKYILSILIFAISINSCGNPGEGENVEKAREDVINVVKNLPNLKKEVDELEEKLDAKQVTGLINMTIGDVTKNLSRFSGKKSDITFNEGIAKYKIYTDESRKERIIIILSNKDLYNLKNRSFMASIHGDMKDLKLMKKRLEKYIQFEYYNENTKERYNSHEGTITLDEFSDSTLKFTYNDQGAIGDWRMPNLAPMKLTVDLKCNFVSYDFRKTNK